MKNIADLMKELGIKSDKPKQYSAEDRLRLLGIDDGTAEKIRYLPFERVDFDQDDYCEIKNQEIDLNSLVGINRNDNVSNWLELLFSLHKLNNFSNFKSREQFQNFIDSLDENSSPSLPIVIDINGKYYIDAEGKHRLTIDKCVGVDKFPVMVCGIKPSSL